MDDAGTCRPYAFQQRQQGLCGRPFELDPKADGDRVVEAPVGATVTGVVEAKSPREMRYEPTDEAVG